MSFRYLLKAILLITSSLMLASSEKILFLSLPYYGHINPLATVAAQLTKYGHTSYIPIPAEYSGKFAQEEKGVNFLITDSYPEITDFNNVISSVLEDTDQYKLADSFHYFHKVLDRYLLNEKLFLKLKSLNASLAVIDANFVSNSLAIIAYRLQIPFVLQGLHNQNIIHRTPWAMSIFPHFSINRAEVTSFPMKLRNIWAHFQEYINPPAGSPGRNVKYYAPERPDISFDDLIRQASFYVIDSDYFLHVPLPALPNVKYIGGISTHPAGPLKDKFLDFVKTSKNGIIIVSPGTFVNWDMSLNKMAEAFSKIQYDVVWKHPNFSISRPNILITKWLPQNDLLGHPNTKLFISHCGNSGQYESLYHAVPLICFPLLADQIFNGRNIQAKKYGMNMNVKDFTVDELINNIKEVIENPDYKKNIAKVSEIFRSPKELPSERVARHFNEIVKYGGDHLRSKIQDVPLYEFFLLDILAIGVIFCVAILSLVYFILRKCFALVCTIKKKKKE